MATPHLRTTAGWICLRVLVIVSLLLQSLAPWAAPHVLAAPSAAVLVQEQPPVDRAIETPDGFRGYTEGPTWSEYDGLGPVALSVPVHVDLQIDRYLLEAGAQALVTVSVYPEASQESATAAVRLVVPAELEVVDGAGLDWNVPALGKGERFSQALTVRIAQSVTSTLPVVVELTAEATAPGYLSFLDRALLGLIPAKDPVGAAPPPAIQETRQTIQGTVLRA